MLCPRCHGKGWVSLTGSGDHFYGTPKAWAIPCPDCHAGRVSCSEGSERTGGVTDMEAEKRGAFKAAYEERGG